MYYQRLKENGHIILSANPKDFLVDWNHNISLKRKNAMFAKGQPTDATPEAGVQKWFNELDWSHLGLKYTTFSCDTHAKPLSNGRKPDASHMGAGYAKSVTNVAVVCDLKKTTNEVASTSGSSDFSKDDKGKALDLAQATLKEQKHLRSAGIPCYLCDGVHIQFFLYEESRDNVPRVIESPVMLLVGNGGVRDGGVWLISLLTTSLRHLGISLPDVIVSGKPLPIYGLLGVGGSSRVLLSVYEGEQVAVKWRVSTEVDYSISDSEFEIQRTAQQVPGLNVPRIVVRSDCGECLFLCWYFCQFYCCC